MICEMFPYFVFVVIVEAFMQIRLIKKHKDKTITHMVHKVLTWFDKPCPMMKKSKNITKISIIFQISEVVEMKLAIDYRSGDFRQKIENIGDILPIFR